MKKRNTLKQEHQSECGGAHVVVVVLVVQIRSIHSKRSERDQQPAESELWQHGLLESMQCRDNGNRPEPRFTLSHSPDVTAPKQRGWASNILIMLITKESSLGQHQNG